MPRYILLSFLFMGWGFYELSGGAEFQPPQPVASAEAATPKAPATTRIAKSQMARASQARTATPAPTRTETPRAEEPQVVLASLGADEGTNKTNRATPAAQTAEPEPRVFSLQDMVTPPPAANAANPNGIQQVRPTPTRAADMREIVATRVNMRAGPGTSSDILMRLAKGDSVEVLEDNGSGWLRLRALPADRVGWIAARLVSPQSD
ncbi:SH3 domain-containing protein [Arenibacterium halophilum]|nr:SH3 domain-containing protein [Arenibacterium halophilum]